MDKINQIWPAWHTVELIGRGSFGDVYKAKREVQGEIFYSAVKVIQIPRDEQDIREMMEEGHTSQSIRYYYESVAKDLMNEIKVLEALKSAGNVMNIEDFDIRERKEGIGWEVYIRMELLENLDAYRQKHTMTVQDMVKLGIDLCSALEYCEKSKIIHRDIKPKNIFVDGYGNYKLGDFGIARQMEKTQSTLSQKGTELYMAPEVRFGMSGSSYNVDIYSLGLVVYRLLNKNRMPFEPVGQEFLTYRDKETAIERRLKGEALPNPVDADEELSKIIRKACEADKDRRYRSASEMKQDLEVWLQQKEDSKEAKKTETENLHKSREQAEPLNSMQDLEDDKTISAWGEKTSQKEEAKKESETVHVPKDGEDVHLTKKIVRGQKTVLAEVEDDQLRSAGQKITQNITISIPSDIKNGQRICLKGKGRPGEYGGKAGDLYVTFLVEEPKKTFDEKKEIKREEKVDKAQEYKAYNDHVRKIKYYDRAKVGLLTWMSIGVILGFVAQVLVLSGIIAGVMGLGYILVLKGRKIGIFLCSFGSIWVMTAVGIGLMIILPAMGVGIGSVAGMVMTFCSYHWSKLLVKTHMEEKGVLKKNG